MKTKLLKKLRRNGRDQIHILSTTKTNGIMTGMSISHNGGEYGKLFEYGDSEEDVLKKAEHIYINDYLKSTKNNRS